MNEKQIKELEDAHKLCVLMREDLKAKVLVGAYFIDLIEDIKKHIENVMSEEGG